MHPCDPPNPCPEGQAVDYEICKCVDDPNATTPKPTKKPKGSQSRESSRRSSLDHDKSKESSEKKKRENDEKPTKS